MLIIDGNLGEGGGQILRTALALAMCTRQGVDIVNIRAKRSKPGLMRQHLTAVQAAVNLCHGEVQGAEMGSREIRFQPKDVKPGSYAISVGTAGSTGLVFQTLLPALLTVPEPSTLILEGGTHNPYAPPFDFIQQTFLPLLNRMGATIEAHLERPGFYPAGGGRWSATVQGNQQLRPLILNERGAVLARTATAIRAGLPAHITERELKVVQDRLSWNKECLQSIELPGEYGPGNCLNLTVRCEHICEVFTGFGQRRISAEEVAKRTVKRVQRYLVSEVATAEYLADQLLLPLALAGGGEFTSLKPTQHTLTNIAVIRRFLPLDFVVEKMSSDAYRFRIERLKTNAPSH